MELTKAQILKHSYTLALFNVKRRYSPLIPASTGIHSNLFPMHAALPLTISFHKNTSPDEYRTIDKIRHPVLLE